MKRTTRWLMWQSHSTTLWLGNNRLNSFATHVEAFQASVLDKNNSPFNLSQLILQYKTEKKRL